MNQANRWTRNLLHLVWVLPLALAAGLVLWGQTERVAPPDLSGCLTLEAEWRVGEAQRRLVATGQDIAVTVPPGTTVSVRWSASPEPRPPWTITITSLFLTGLTPPTMPSDLSSLRCLRDGELPIIGLRQAFTEPGTVKLSCVARLACTRPGGFGRGVRWVVEASQSAFIIVSYPPSAYQEGYVRGQYVGEYGDQLPASFIEVPPEAVNAKISEHFTLGEFAAYWRGGRPAYAPIIALDWALVVKLERLIAALAERGIPCTDLVIQSGYRSPAYNDELRAESGNAQAQRSRHLMGDAADIIVDEDRNGKMDDLDGNGKTDLADCILLGKVIRALEDAGQVSMGGVGVYQHVDDGRVHHNVHVDCRGFRATWGRDYAQDGPGGYREIPW